uniref:Uncharacterized protein n=1 Tax=Strongyloides papillosus TaxID=174720 RepID=A0A0N5CCZ4_STREA
RFFPCHFDTACRIRFCRSKL